MANGRRGWYKGKDGEEIDLSSEEGENYEHGLRADEGGNRRLRK